VCKQQDSYTHGSTPLVKAKPTQFVDFTQNSYILIAEMVFTWRTAYAEMTKYSKYVA